jgi:iron complex outermembrane receptor protein
MAALALTLGLAASPASAQTSAGAADGRTQQGQPKADNLTQGSLTAYTLPTVTVYGVADQTPTAPVTTRFGAQFNVVTEDQIRLQNSLDFLDALRNVPGVMYQKKNIVGGQTSHSL